MGMYDWVIYVGRAYVDEPLSVCITEVVSQLVVYHSVHEAYYLSS